jgi:hypothetical protein
MAQQAQKSRSSSRRRRGSGTNSRNGRRASQKPEKYRFAQNVAGDETVAEREYRAYALDYADDPSADPDVLLDIPVVKVDSIHLELDELDAHVALKAEVLDLVKLNVGVDVHLGTVKVDLKGVEAQALLKVRLDHVAAIIDRVLTTLDRNPDLVESLGEAVEDLGSGAGQALGETGDAVEEVSEGAEGAVKDVGQGAGQAVGDLGDGASQAAGQLGEGAGEAVGQVGEGAGQAAGQLGQGVGQAAGDLGQGVDGPGGAGTASAGGLAKAAAKTMAKELGSAASEEAKDLGLAATRKARELGERRRHRRAEKHNATEAAMSAAEALHVDLALVEGSGAEGRITVKDVRDAQKAEA